MKSTDKQYIQKQIDKLQKKRDKSTDTFEIVRLATKISRLKEDLDFFSDERFSKDGNRKFCKYMYFTTAEAGILTLQMLATEKQIGEEFEESDVHELPKVEIEFFTPKSIDVLIVALEAIKKNYIPPPSYDQLALAC